MRAFRLKVEDENTVQSFEFEGDDPHRAFAIFESDRRLRKASLWEGDKRLGQIVRDENGVWLVGGGEG